MYLKKTIYIVNVFIFFDAEIFSFLNYFHLKKPVVYRGRGNWGISKTVKPQDFSLKYRKPHWNSRKIPSLTNVVKKLPSPKYRTKLEFLPNTAAQNTRKTTYRRPRWNRNTADFDRKYRKTVRWLRTAIPQSSIPLYLIPQTDLADRYHKVILCMETQRTINNK